MPAEIAVANTKQIKQGLLESYWGDTSDLSEKEIDDNWEGVRIIVTDDFYDYDPEVPTIEDVIAAIAKYSTKVKVK